MCIPHIAFYLETFEMINKCRHSTPILYTGDINNQEEVISFKILFSIILSFLHLGSLDVWQVFEFLFQNKYTADEDVDLEEVKAKGRCWGDFETHWDDLGTGRVGIAVISVWMD